MTFFPHRLASLVHVTVRPSDHIGVCANIKTASNVPTGFRHYRLHRGNVFIKAREGSGYKESIMNRCTNFNSGLRACYGRNPHHFGPVGLHRKIHKRARIWFSPDVVSPTKNRLYFVGQHCARDDVIHPLPEWLIGLLMQPKELLRLSRSDAGLAAIASGPIP